MEKLKSEGKYRSPDRQGGSDVDGVGGHLPDRWSTSLDDDHQLWHYLRVSLVDD